MWGGWSKEARGVGALQWLGLLAFEGRLRRRSEGCQQFLRKGTAESDACWDGWDGRDARQGVVARTDGPVDAWSCGLCGLGSGHRLVRVTLVPAQLPLLQLLLLLLPLSLPLPTYSHATPVSQATSCADSTSRERLGRAGKRRLLRRHDADLQRCGPPPASGTQRTSSAPIAAGSEFTHEVP